MRIVIVGQQAFGKAVLEAFIARGDEIAAVFAAPERPGTRPDPLVAAASPTTRAGNPLGNSKVTVVSRPTSLRIDAEPPDCRAKP